jgi:hypothetical protein
LHSAGKAGSSETSSVPTLQFAICSCVSLNLIYCTEPPSFSFGERTESKWRSFTDETSSPASNELWLSRSARYHNSSGEEPPQRESTAPGKFPIILERTGYGKGYTAASGNYFVPRGYVARCGSNCCFHRLRGLGFPCHRRGRHPQRLRNRQTASVRTPPALEASVNPLHAGPQAVSF